MTLKRSRCHRRFAQVVGFKTGAIDNEDAVLLQVGNIHLQRRGIHSHQDVHRVTGSVNVGRSEGDLETAYSGKRSGRSADFSRVVWECGKIVAVKTYGVGELTAGNLHAVTGVAAKADDSAVNYFATALLRFRNRSLRNGSHKSFRSPMAIFILNRQDAVSGRTYSSETVAGL